jgi:Carboxypeptidase regulatory-like domain
MIPFESHNSDWPPACRCGTTVTATFAASVGRAIVLPLWLATAVFAQTPNNRSDPGRNDRPTATGVPGSATPTTTAAEGGAARIALLSAGKRASVVVDLEEDVPQATATEATDPRSVTVVIGPVKRAVVNQVLQAAAGSPLVSQVRILGVTQGNQGTLISVQIIGRSPISGSVRRVKRRVYIDIDPQVSPSVAANRQTAGSQGRSAAASRPARGVEVTPSPVARPALPESPAPPAATREVAAAPPTVTNASPTPIPAETAKPAADPPSELAAAPRTATNASPTPIPAETAKPAADPPSEIVRPAASVSRVLGTSWLQGTVTGPTGVVIGGAMVTIENSSAQAWNSTTDQQGRYIFEWIPPGAYRLTVNTTGFHEFSAPIELAPETTTPFNVGLKVGLSVALEVLSTDPRKNGSAVILTGSRIDALPNDPRLFLNRLLQIAGSTGRDDVAVYVDGFREYQRLPPKDTIALIRINSNPFSAEFSQPSVRRIEVTTKSGSDNFHGDVKLQVRSSRLDAPNPLAESKPLGEYRNLNGYLQGPIRKERVGFLFYAGQWRQDDSAFVHATVLDSAAALAQPFSATVSTPERVTSSMLQTDFTLGNQTINASYSRTDDTHLNQGLDGGFDLPERAYERSSRDDVGRLWWTSIGERSVNDIRFELTRNHAVSSTLTTAPAILVFDAFNAGGNQNADSRATTNLLQASETFTLLAGTHALKAGVQADIADQTSIDRSGFGGTFTFGADVERNRSGAPVLDTQQQPTSVSPIENYRRTVLGLPGYGPSQFAVVAGDPEVAVTQWNAAPFVLDDWSISRRVLLSYGVRQELQNNVKLRVNLAPRASLTWLVDAEGHNGVKLGAGLFYSRVEPGITFDTRKLDGTRRRQFVVQRPDFFPSVPTSFDLGALSGSTVYVKSDDLRAPLSLITTVSYERQLPYGLSAVVEYLYGRGLRQLRLREITRSSSDASPSRILQFESTGRSQQDELMLNLRGDLGSRLSLFGTYRIGRKSADTDGAYTIPADSMDLSSEYGPSADDRRHQIVASATLQAFGGLIVEPAVVAASGRPFNITTGLDNNGDTFFMDRPAFAVAGQAGAITTPLGVFNPNPQPGDVIVPRNFGREPWDVSVALAISKALWQGVTISADAENLLNTVRFVNVNGVLTSPVFGMPNQALNGRRLELSIRYGF